MPKLDDTAPAVSSIAKTAFPVALTLEGADKQVSRPTTVLITDPVYWPCRRQYLTGRRLIALLFARRWSATSRAEVGRQFVESGKLSEPLKNFAGMFNWSRGSRAKCLRNKGSLKTAHGDKI